MGKGKGLKGVCRLGNFLGREGIICSFVILVFFVFSSTACAKGRWYEYKGCKLIEEEYYDGDSFHVQTKSRHYIFRLYFVDAPETDMLIPERVKDQAKYWGIDEKRVIDIAAEAREFTRKFLSKGFTVYSKKQDAWGRSKKERFFGMIKVGDKYLSEALVEHGYARVYGAWTKLRDGRTSWKFKSELKDMEDNARKKEKGAWAKIAKKGGG